MERARRARMLPIATFACCVCRRRKLILVTFALKLSIESNLPECHEHPTLDQRETSERLMTESVEKFAKLRCHARRISALRCWIVAQDSTDGDPGGASHAVAPLREAAWSAETSLGAFERVH